jgi:hypothetical protein
MLSSIKILFVAIVSIHGLIHLLGFAKAFKIGELEQLTQPISKPFGLLWLAATALFLLTVPIYLLKKDWWWMIALAAVIISQLVVFYSWQDAKFGTIANIIVLIAVILGYGQYSFSSWYKTEAKAGLVQTAAISDSILTETDINYLPEPVKKYLRYTGAIGKPKVNNFKVKFDGKIRKNEESEWMTFTSEQYNFQESATRLFFMDAVMKNLPVAGFHCFKNGKAFMDIRLLSLLKVQYQDGEEMNVAETVTFFNDMSCMAPATLIDKRIQWLEVENNKVKAEFTNNNITISAWLYFNEKGELINFISNDRYAADAGKRLPWSTPIKDYKEMNGRMIPGYAEAVYTYPTGDSAYGTFSFTDIEYNVKDLD